MKRYSYRIYDLKYKHKNTRIPGTRRKLPEVIELQLTLKEKDKVESLLQTTGFTVENEIVKKCYPRLTGISYAQWLIGPYDTAVRRKHDDGVIDFKTNNISIVNYDETLGEKLSRKLH